MQTMSIKQVIRPFHCLKVVPKINDVTGVLEPHPRSGHRLVADDVNIYSIGGYNPDFWDVENVDDTTYYPLFKELWQLNQATRRWTKLTTTGPMPVELASHSALLDGDHMLVFGGTGVPFGESASNRLNICNLSTLNWSILEATGTFPIKVYGQAIILHKNCMYMFGGTTGWQYNSEFHKLDLDTGQWTEVEVCGVIPEGRYRHEMAVYDDKFFIFGGGRSYCSYGFQMIPVFCTKTSRWSEMPIVPDRTHGFPAARRCHSCVQLQQDAYICGGYDGEVIFDDIWKLDMMTLRWTKLRTILPEPVYFHSAAISPAGCMYIFGGVTVIDHIRTSSVYKVWLRPPPTLRELCWHSIVETTPHLDKIPRNTLLELGIPSHYVSRIGDSHEPSVCG